MGQLDVIAFLQFAPQMRSADAQNGQPGEQLHGTDGKSEPGSKRTGHHDFSTT